MPTAILHSPLMPTPKRPSWTVGRNRSARASGITEERINPSNIGTHRESRNCNELEGAKSDVRAAMSTGMYRREGDREAAHSVAERILRSSQRVTLEGAVNGGRGGAYVHRLLRADRSILAVQRRCLPLGMQIIPTAEKPGIEHTYTLLFYFFFRESSKVHWRAFLFFFIFINFFFLQELEGASERVEPLSGRRMRSPVEREDLSPRRRDGIECGAGGKSGAATTWPWCGCEYVESITASVAGVSARCRRGVHTHVHFAEPWSASH